MSAELIARQMRDIQGLDPIGPWPLAPGWWLVILAGIMLLCLAVIAWRWFTLWRHLPRGNWRRDAVKQIRQLRRQLGQSDDQGIAAELSQLLRRIAMARCGRDSCAGLSGVAWLNWLRQHDHNDFDWPQKGRLLIDLPYAPPGHTEQPAKLVALLDAALAWTIQPDHGHSEGAEP